MYDWLIGILDLPVDAPEYIVYFAAALVLLAFCFLSKLLYKAVFR